MKRKQIILLTASSLIMLCGINPSHAQAATDNTALAKSLQNIYLYWRNAMIAKNYNGWKQITASHRRTSIQNRILSEKGQFPNDIFSLPTPPPGLKGLKLLRCRSKGVTAKLVYFGKVDFGVGGKPTENLLVFSFVHENRSWKYDTAEFVNLNSIKDVRAQLKAGKYGYVDGSAFLPDGKAPVQPITVQPAKYIAKVYTFCPGREVRVSVNKISKHRFQDTQQAEVIIGGARDGINEIWFSINNLPDYKGSDPITIRVYLFSQIKGVKPIKVFQYQTAKGEQPKKTGSTRFTIDAATGAKLLGK